MIQLSSFIHKIKLPLLENRRISLFHIHLSYRGIQVCVRHQGNEAKLTKHNLHDSGMHAARIKYSSGKRHVLLKIQGQQNEECRGRTVLNKNVSSVHLMNGSFNLTTSGPACLNEQSSKHAENPSVCGKWYFSGGVSTLFVCWGLSHRNPFLGSAGTSQTGLLPELSLSMKQTLVLGSGWHVMLTSVRFVA